MRFRVLALVSLVLAAQGCSEARRASELDNDSAADAVPRAGSSPRADAVAGSESVMTKPMMSKPGMSRPVPPPPAPEPPRNGLPPGSCPAIACALGMQVNLRETARSFAYLRSLRYELCRNERCSSGSLDANADPPPNGRGNGVGFTLPALNMGPGEDRVEMHIFSDGVGGYDLQAYWTPWSVDYLKDGDHYVIRVTDPAGRTGVLLDARAMYKDTSFREPCYQHCKLGTLDQRASGFPELGDEDAGVSR